MRVLGSDVPLLLWSAERPFQIQLLAAFARLGFDVTAVCQPHGKALVDKIYPKNYPHLEVPKEFEGALLWAPESELFKGHALSEKSLNEIRNLITLAQNDSKISECFLFLPHHAYGQVEIPKENFYALYLPPLVGFGDKHVFDKILDQVLTTGSAGTAIEAELLSLFDAISFAISFIKLEDRPREVWEIGHKISEDALDLGFEEASEESSIFGTLKLILLKLQKKDLRFQFKSVEKPEKIDIAIEIFPTVLTPWERFFRDTYRIYKDTPDSSLLLHFRPTKTP